MRKRISLLLLISLPNIYAAMPTKFGSGGASSSSSSSSSRGSGGASSSGSSSSSASAETSSIRLWSRNTVTDRYANPIPARHGSVASRIERIGRSWKRVPWFQTLDNYYFSLCASIDNIPDPKCESLPSNRGPLIASLN